MARRARDPRLDHDPPGYEGPRTNRDGSVSYYHRYRVGRKPRVETIRSHRGASDPAASARARAWADYDQYLLEKEAGGLDDRRDRKQRAQQPIRPKLAEWFQSQRSQWDKTTRSNYMTQIDKRIDPYWGDRLVAAAGRKKNITDFRNWLMEPANGYGTEYSLPTVQLAMAVFSSFCTWLADEDDSIDVNPCPKVKVVDGDYAPDKTRKRSPMTPEQIERVSFAFARLTRKVGGGRGRKGVEQPLPEREVWMHRVVLYLLAYLGIRPEDITLARWADVIDEDTREFRTHMTVLRAKTVAGTKPRELLAPVVDVLRIYYRLSGSPELDTPMIIGARGGGFNRHNWLADFWRPAFAISKVKPYRVPYAARHSAASNLAIAGWDPGSVSDQMGNSTPSFTMTRYRHQFADAAKRRGIPIENQIRDARIKVFGYDLGEDVGSRPRPRSLRRATLPRGSGSTTLRSC